MLLNEVVRPELKVKHSGIEKFDPESKRAKQRFNKVGTGMGSGLLDSGIYIDEKHPNRVLKVVRIRNTADPYLRFIRMIEQYQNNPFFPRIYGYKVYQQEDGDYDGLEKHLILYVFMEKLMPLHKLGEEMVENIFARLRIPFMSHWRITDHYGLRDYLRSPQARSGMRNTTPNPKFKEALRLLEPMIKAFGNDMHVDNFMVRLTSVGPQLVITDPLYPDFGDDDAYYRPGDYEHGFDYMQDKEPEFG